MGFLAEPWPGDLDPARVPFRQRTITVLKGMRLWDDMTRIDELTVDDVAGYWVTGPVTVNDLITSGNERTSETDECSPRSRMRRARSAHTVT